MSTNHNKPLALIIGVGESTGKSVCLRLAPKYRLAMVARSTSVTDSIVSKINDARGFSCDIGNRTAWSETLKTIKQEMGLPARILINTENSIWGDFREISLDNFAGCFEQNAVSLLVLAQTLFKDTGKKPLDCRIVLNTSPAAYVSSSMFLGIAPSRTAQRVLAEALHEVLAPSGVAFSVLNIDGVINEPRMKSLFADSPDDFFIEPDALAERIEELFENKPVELSPRITAPGNPNGIAG